MASTSAITSASSVLKSYKYDVFLSFRGEDTRKNFVDHLYHALKQKNIITYKDDEKIEKGERIGDQLMRSIEESRFFIIVLSKNYASSSWCLDELVKIMECQKTTEQTCYPVFYDVEPTEVRHQSGVVGEAFTKHVEKEDARRWRDALKGAANLSGWELKNTFEGHEAKFIQKIVQEISIKLHFVSSSIDGKLVGMESRVKNVVSSLESGYDDVRMIGIKGMGGGGKTTLARAVFDLISVWFEGKSFVENVREVSKRSGMKELQKHVLSTVSNDQSISVASVSDGKNMMRKMMRGRKALVVLDDVDDIEQLEALAGELAWFKPGSRIIITTRDQQVLVAHQVNFIHDVNLLSNEEAICLFSRYAFGKDIPIQGFERLSAKVVHYAAGLPLTIKVLGSHLCGRSAHEWVDAIERLKTIPLDKTLKRLELSYNGLENDQKEIFLDVVCILKGEQKEKAIRILESCGFNAQIGLSVLEQKSLITISDHDLLVLYDWFDYHDCLGFHDHIEEMGRNIVRRLHPHEPSRHSRLWIKEEIEDILVNESGTEEIKCIKLSDTDLLQPTIIMRGLRKMKELRFLHVSVGFEEWKVDEAYQYLPDALCSLYWDRYPFRSLPKTFQAKKIVNLELPWSNIYQLWEGGVRKVLDKLRYLKLKGSKLRTFDLGMTPHLETLDLSRCYRLVELHMPVECPKLKILNLSYTKVSNLNLGLTPHLVELYLKSCRYLQEVHAPMKCLEKLLCLNLGNSLRFLSFMMEKLKVLPDPGSLAKLKLIAESVEICPLHPNNNLPKFQFICEYVEPLFPWTGNLERLLSFGLCACTNLEALATTICNLQCLKKLSLEGGIPEVPKNIGHIQTLKKLSLWLEEIKHLPDSICKLKHLKSLDLTSCFLLEQLPKDLGKLESLEVLDLRDCRSLRDIPKSICKMKSLKHLDLYRCLKLEKLPDELGSLECLEKLNLRECSSLRDVPESICKMTCLEHLNLCRCHQVEKLPEELGCLLRLKTLNIKGAGVSRLPWSIYQLKGLHILRSYGFTYLTEIVGSENSEFQSTEFEDSEPSDLELEDIQSPVADFKRTEFEDFEDSETSDLE